MSPLADHWEFAPGRPSREPLSVGELTRRIRSTLEREVGWVRVSGEVGQPTRPSSGHIYFELKDHEAQISCVLFRGKRISEATRARIQLGRQLVLEGNISVYEQRGRYQLIVESVEIAGEGALHLAFEELKRRLQAEGLFEPERKRVLPACPFRIGLVTSPTGAVIRDIETISARRNPALVYHLVPVRVQGTGAAGEIAAAIAHLNHAHRRGRVLLDAIVLARGGGSLEELWPFNEEVVARAVSGSSLPIVSAVGHQTDTTISDFVADHRAPTPSAAAEILTQKVHESIDFVRRSDEELADLFRRNLEDLASRHPLPDAHRILRRILARGLEQREEKIHQLDRRLQGRHPRQILERRQQRMDDLEGRMQRIGDSLLDEGRRRLDQATARLDAIGPGRILSRQSEHCERLGRLLQERARHRLQHLGEGLARLESGLGHLSHRKVLERGYSITRIDATGRILKSAGEVHGGETLVTLLDKGEVRSRVEK